ncbi:hypothetical protein E4U54_005321 [Claviceps lovelessii]|nr:hypothetical protein E4U54_005321 [Claviceps lovelessii]
MSSKTGHARIKELNDKLRKKSGLRARIETMQREMQDILDQMSAETAKQLTTSSIAAMLKRPNAQKTSMEMEDEIDALRDRIAELKAEEAYLESQIESLQG